MLFRAKKQLIAKSQTCSKVLDLLSMGEKNSNKSFMLFLIQSWLRNKRATSVQTTVLLLYCFVCLSVFCLCVSLLSNCNSRVALTIPGPCFCLFHYSIPPPPKKISPVNLHLCLHLFCYSTVDEFSHIQCTGRQRDMCKYRLEGWNSVIGRQEFTTVCDSLKHTPSQSISHLHGLHQTPCHNNYISLY